MIKTFLEKYIKIIVNHPNDTLVKEYQNESCVSFTIYVHPEDMGKVIGKNANMITAINTFMGVCFSKNKISYKAFIKNIYEEK